jgi:hypothetical protein
MKIIRKYLLPLIILYLGICSVGFFLSAVLKISFSFPDLLVLASIFLVINFLQLYIFFRGQFRSPESTTMHTLVSVTAKFLLEMVLALIWFIVIKKTQVSAVVMFFVLYLTLTLFTTFVMLKTLKINTLNKEVLV